MQYWLQNDIDIIYKISWSWQEAETPEERRHELIGSYEECYLACHGLL